MKRLVFFCLSDVTGQKIIIFQGIVVKYVNFDKNSPFKLSPQVFSSQMNTNKKGLKSYVRELLMTLYHLINCYSVIRLVFHIHGILWTFGWIQMRRTQSCTRHPVASCNSYRERTIEVWDRRRVLKRECWQQTTDTAQWWEKSIEARI